MNIQQLNAGLEYLVNESILNLDDNLKAIFMFGSGNHLRDFIPNLSDLDFIYILGVINYKNLQKISSIREDANNVLNIKVDIKPFSIDEYSNGIKGKSSFEFFTGWGLEMMKRGEQRCLYNSGEIRLDYEISDDRIKKDAIERAHYYVTKLRKTFSASDKSILRGEYKGLDNEDKLKIVSSSIKNVLTFCLAYKGIFVNSYDEVLDQSRFNFGEVSDFEELFRTKKEVKYDKSILIKAYDKIEQIYKGVINE